MGWTFSEISQLPNWIILTKLVFPLKSFLIDTLNNEKESYDISMHIQRSHDVSSQKGMPINEGILDINGNTVITRTIEKVFGYIIDIDYVEYDIFRATKLFSSFRLYIEQNTIRIIVRGKELKYNDQEAIGNIIKIGDELLLRIDYHNK